MSQVCADLFGTLHRRPSARSARIIMIATVDVDEEAVQCPAVPIYKMPEAHLTQLGDPRQCGARVENKCYELPNLNSVTMLGKTYMNIPQGHWLRALGWTKVCKANKCREKGGCPAPSRAKSAEHLLDKTQPPSKRKLAASRMGGVGSCDDDGGGSGLAGGKVAEEKAASPEEVAEWRAWRAASMRSQAGVLSFHRQEMAQKDQAVAEAVAQKDQAVAKAAEAFNRAAFQANSFIHGALATYDQTLAAAKAEAKAAEERARAAEERARAAEERTTAAEEEVKQLKGAEMGQEVAAAKAEVKAAEERARAAEERARAAEERTTAAEEEVKQLKGAEMGQAGQVAASTASAEPGGFAEYNRTVPFWAVEQSFMTDLGLRIASTRHADRNLCLCFSYLVSAGEILEKEQR